MSENALTETELSTFYEKAKEGLSDAQAELLHAICKIAWQITAKEQSLEAGFTQAYEPDEADLILKYAGNVNAGPGYAMFPRMISETLIR